MTKREYPLFMIDRSKSESYPYDYIICLDREVGFVARVMMMYDEQMLQDFINRISQVPDSELTTFSYRLKRGAIILIVEDFLYYIEPTPAIKARVQALMKKAMKKYLFATIEHEPNAKDYGIDNQIKQQQLTLDRARSNYSALLQRAPDKESADYTIALAEATLETLKDYKRIKEKLAKMFN